MKVRSLALKFWSDSYIFELPAKQKLLFNYLITNEHTNMPGIYELHDKYILFETDLTASDLEEAKVRFDKDKKFSFYEGWCFVHNNHKHNSYSWSQHVVNAFVETFNKIPRSVRTYFLEERAFSYTFPFKTNGLRFLKDKDDFDLEVDYRHDIDIDIDMRVGTRLGLIQNDSKRYNEERVDPDSIPDLENWGKGTGRINSFLSFLLVLLLASFIPHTINAAKIEKRVVVSSKHATQYPEELKSLTPQKQATPTRLKSGQQKSGAGTPKASTARVNKPTPPPVEAVYAPLPDFKKEVARKIKDAFPNHAREMIAIAFAESGLNCGAINQADSNGYKAVGVFQINDGRVFNDQDIANLTNCDHNIERAKQKYQASGLQPWGVYWSGAFQRYLWIYDEI